MKGPIPRYYIYSGPDYIDHGRFFSSLDEAKETAEKRGCYHFIFNQARIIQVVSESYRKHCELIKVTPPKPGMVWRGTPACKLQGY